MYAALNRHVKLPRNTSTYVINGVYSKSTVLVTLSTGKKLLKEMAFISHL